MCIFANEGGPKSKSSRKETPLKIQKYKEIHVSGKNLEKKMFLGMSAPTPIQHFADLLLSRDVLSATWVAETRKEKNNKFAN